MRRPVAEHGRQEVLRAQMLWILHHLLGWPVLHDFAHTQDVEIIRDLSHPAKSWLMNR